MIRSTVAVIWSVEAGGLISMAINGLRSDCDLCALSWISRCCCAVWQVTPLTALLCQIFTSLLLVADIYKQDMLLQADIEQNEMGGGSLCCS